ncbi:MAG: MFS transporter [Acidithiobacillus sp.]|uniref:MFS transporter n=1 Tax=Acidithiobacillus sp. TaxID=1872118 RepID=UPI003D08E723
MNEQNPRRSRRSERVAAVLRRINELVRIPRLRLRHITIVEPKTFRTAMTGMIVGNFMEWFDVGVYGYLAVIMGQLFLSGASPSLQILFSLGVFAVTFVARPFGGMFFGWLGDKVGRKKVLATTLLMMAGSTFLIGLLPTYDRIGVLAPAALVLLKLLQGFSTGGEYAGATTFISEYAPDKRRGFLASFLDLGSYMGFAVGAALVSLLQIFLDPRDMLAYGWRIPFLVAGPLSLFAIYFRMRVEESPAFRELLHEGDQEASTSPESTNPVAVIRGYWRPILVAMGLVAATQTVGYALTSYMPTYFTKVLNYDAAHGTLLTVPVIAFMALSLPFVGRLSDRTGRRPMLWTGSAITILLSVPAFALMGLGHTWSSLAGLFVMAVAATFYTANLASSLPSLFPTSHRYGGMGIAFNISVALFGGTTPFIIESLVQATGNHFAPAYYLMFMSVIGAISIYFMPESARRPLPGSMPIVGSVDDAKELVATQRENPDLVVHELPFPDEDGAVGSGPH